MSGISDLSNAMAARASELLSMLNTEQRRKANLDFDGPERRTWYYTPNDRPGLPVAEMSSRDQQYAAFRLLATGLSESGYNTAVTIMGLENVLARRNGFRDEPYAGRGPETRQRDPTMHFVTVFGEPGGKEPWGWSFSGHHVCVNFTIADGFVATTPAFFGADPALAPMPGGRSLRPLAAEEDMALDLLRIMRPDQLARAIVFAKAPNDIMHANRTVIETNAQPVSVPDMMPPHILAKIAERDMATLEARRRDITLSPEQQAALRYSDAPIGIRASELDPMQAEAFTSLVRLYLDRTPEALAAQYASTMLDGAEFRDTTFAWAGPIDVKSTQYYRIQSKRLLIEYDQAGPESNHLHAVWRDLQYDFGGDPLVGHYEGAHA